MALAQQQGGSAPTQKALEQVTVTGTRLVTSGTNTPVPVTAVTGIALQSMNPGELVNSLSQLPVFDNNYSIQQGSATSQRPGGGTLNLRGLGIQRTLVLLDGRRMGPSNEYGTADVGIIPTNLLQSVETVTGGASAQYGADAVAGVVNFRLNRSFTGLKYSVQGGTTTYRDDNHSKWSVAYGTSIGQHGHIIVSAENYENAGIHSLKSLQERSNFFDLKGQVSNPDPNGPTYLTRSYVQPTNYTAGGILLGPAYNSAGQKVAVPAALDHVEFLPGASGQYQPLPFSGIGKVSGGCNCQALSALPQDFGVNAGDQIDQPGHTGGAFVHYDYNVNDRNSFFLETLLGNTGGKAISQTAALLGGWQAEVFSDNPYLPASIRQTMQNDGINAIGFGIFTPNTAGNILAGSDYITKDRYGQFTSGFTHDMRNSFLGGDWVLDGYVQYAQTRQEMLDEHGPRTDRLFEAMDVVTDPSTGQPVCRVSLPQYDPTGIFSDCVPINLFGGTAAVTPGAAKFVLDDGKLNRGRATEDDTEVNFRGTLTQGSGVLGPISAAFGLSWREEQLNVRTVNPCDEYPCTPSDVSLYSLGVNPQNLRGIQAGVNLDGTVNPNGIPGLRFVPPGFSGDSNSSTVLFSSQRHIAGEYSVREAYFEFGIPLLQNGKLNLDEAAREASYTGSGNALAWKSGLSYQVTPTLRLRATRSQDVRAPTLQERFDQQRGGVNIVDPATNISYQAASFSGGNPNVGVEQGLTSTVGIVFQPVDKFSMTLDWYDINLADAIGQLRGQDIVNDCYNSPGHNSSSLCQYVHRDATGEINRVDNYYINLSNQRVNGFDLELDYSGINVGRGGTLSWRLLGTRLNENSITTPGTPKDDRAGDVGTAQLPKNKLTTNLTYVHGPISIFLQGRYIGGGKMDRFYTQSATAIPGVTTIDNNHVDAVTYTDLSFYLSRGGKNDRSPWQFFVTVNNVFDTPPPAEYPRLSRAGAVQPSNILYDTIGRMFTAGVRVNY